MKRHEAARKEHKDRVAALGCILCAEFGQPGIPAQLHHVREGQGASQRASDWLVVPLCPACHSGPQGIHGDKTMLRIAKWTEMDLLAETIRRLHAG